MGLSACGVLGAGASQQYPSRPSVTSDPGHATHRHSPPGAATRTPTPATTPSTTGVPSRTADRTRTTHNHPGTDDYCAESQLRATVDPRHIPGNDTSDLHGRTQKGIRIDFQNTSTSDCVLYGYPGSATEDANNHQLQQARRTLRGRLGGLPSSQDSPARLTLTPGSYAAALIEGVEQNGQRSRCDASTPRILITPPNTDIPVLFRFALSVCSTYTVHPVRALSAPPTTATNAASVTRRQAVANAASYATSLGYRTGIAVYDTKTGATYGENSGSTFTTESVVKTMIAARILRQGRMHGNTARRAYKMITQSDDAIATSFYAGVGGDHLISWVKDTYDIPGLGSKPRRTGFWGNTHVTAAGLVEFYAKVKRDKQVGPWLIDAMHHATEHGSDGVYQYFGIKSAAKGAAIKQGWGKDYDDSPATAEYNTTGFVDDDRYAVAVLGNGPISTYDDDIGHMLTETAERLLPGGDFPAPLPVVTSISDEHGPDAGGTRITIHGHHLKHATAVLFGDGRSTQLTAVSPTKLEVTIPQHEAGRTEVRVATTHGTSSKAHAPHFTFDA